MKQSVQCHIPIACFQLVLGSKWMRNQICYIRQSDPMLFIHVCLVRANWIHWIHSYGYTHFIYRLLLVEWNICYTLCTESIITWQWQWCILKLMMDSKQEFKSKILFSQTEHWHRCPFQLGISHRISKFTALVWTTGILKRLHSKFFVFSWQQHKIHKLKDY